MNIPFNKPFLIGQELSYVEQAVKSGHIAGNGAFTKKCQNFLQEKLGARKILLTPSCTAALEMSAILCDIGPEDEIILPSFTFVSTANAFYLLGAKLKFVDIRPDTLNIDEKKIEEAITKRTKAIVPMHYGGIGCAMDTITRIAKKHGLLVIEDAAHAINATYQNQFLGTIGDLGAFSFHETKNFICGEGGAIVINNEKFLDRADVIWEKGTNRIKFFEGKIDKYTWVDVGSSYVLSDVLAAFLFAQLENLEKITQRRKEIFDLYLNEFSALAEKGSFQLPTIPRDCQSGYHCFYLIVEDANLRRQLLNYLNQKKIGAVFHYVPLHLSPIGRSFGYRDRQLPMTESISERLIRLPFYYTLSVDEQLFVIDQVKKFFKEALKPVR